MSYNIYYIQHDNPFEKQHLNNDEDNENHNNASKCCSKNNQKCYLLILCISILAAFVYYMGNYIVYMNKSNSTLLKN